MGGRQQTAGIQSIKLDVISHTQLMEQSYRQAPFITSYAREKVTRDFAKNRLVDVEHLVWPESDPKQAESDRTLVVIGDGCGYRGPAGDSPCGLATLDAARQDFALGPERLLVTAADAADLHFETSRTLRSTPHSVVGFHWNKIPVRIYLNASNHLPDAVETTQSFGDFWYFWGDVTQRIYFDNWQFINGVVYPTNQVIERNGAVWKSTQVIGIELNPALDEKDFMIDAKVLTATAKQKPWGLKFQPDSAKHLAPGVDFFAGSWNTTIIKQRDGLVILETPISGSYTQSVFDEAKKRYPGVPLKAVLSTSDSWPHVGGVRQDVAQGLPVYILDLNRPLLDRIVAAPHTLDPDALQRSPKSPQWRIVSGKTVVGDGANRLELYPLRGASTERQYLVYFPEHRLVYASDTLVINPDKTLYDPELFREVKAAVEREHLSVETVFAMHQEPVPWSTATALLSESQKPSLLVAKPSQ
jgi:hypothetical protein